MRDTLLGDARARAFFEDFIAGGGRILSSNGEVRRRVAAGEFAVGITDTDDANVARLEGKPIGVVFPDAQGMGTLLIPSCAVLIAGGPHGAEGRAFIDFLLSPGTEGALAASEAAQIPLREGAAVPEGVARLDSIRAMDVDDQELAVLLEELTRGFLKDWVDTNSR